MSSSTISFSLLGATPATYSQFIQRLKERLIAGQPTSQGIPVLRRKESVQPRDRFIYVDLTNYNEDTIRIAIDVVNVYVVGYRSLAPTGTHSFLFKNDPQNQAPLNGLFPDTTKKQLPFTGDYPQLQEYARPPNRGTDEASRRRQLIPMREQIRLGVVELDQAISQLTNFASQAYQAAQAKRSSNEAKMAENLQFTAQAQAFIQIIQMVSEAARFSYIERQVGDCIRTTTSFIPDMRMLSLENSWSRLSAEIMGATRERRERFINSVRLDDANKGAPLIVDNVRSEFVRRKEIAMLLHDGGNDGGYDHSLTDPNFKVPAPSGSGAPGSAGGKKNSGASGSAGGRKKN